MNVGVFVSPELSPVQGLVKPLSMPPELPLIHVDFEHGSDRAWWEELSGTWSVVDGLYDGLAVGAGGNSVFLSDRIRNFRLSFRCRVVSPQPNRYLLSLLVRWRDSSNFYVVTMYTANDPTFPNSVRMYRVLAEVATDLGSASASIATGSFYLLRVDALGSRFSVYLDGAFLFSVTDANISSGRVGCRASSSRAQFDRFTVTRL